MQQYVYYYVLNGVYLSLFTQEICISEKIEADVRATTSLSKEFRGQYKKYIIYTRHNN